MNFQATPESPTSATLTWDPPLPENQNGPITGYFINITTVESGYTFVTSSTSTSASLDTLRPFTTYICVIAAQTSVGIGPYSQPITVMTPEAGMSC